MASHKLSSQDISRWVDAVCDEFDQRWQAGCFPEIEEVIPPDAEDRGVLIAMLRELLPIDMEYRWRNALREPVFVKRRPWLEDYIRRFPILGTSSGTVVGLAQREFRIRQIWGDRPSLATYRQRFSKLSAALEFSLRNVLNELVTTRIKVFRQGDLLLTEQVLRAVSVGRQRANESPPVSFESNERCDRLVIAKNAERRFSREHLHLELVAMDRAVVVNRSETMEVFLGEDSVPLTPGQVHGRRPPVSIVVDDVIIRLSTTFKIPDTILDVSKDVSVHEE